MQQATKIPRLSYRVCTDDQSRLPPIIAGESPRHLKRLVPRRLPHVAGGTVPLVRQVLRECGGHHLEFETQETQQLLPPRRCRREYDAVVRELRQVLHQHFG